MSAERLHAVVEGRVQGVGYRIFVYEAAQALDLTGWVRNLGNGSVEVLAEGEAGALAALLERLKAGPRRAVVTDIRTEWALASGEFAGFEVQPTGW